jgi:hypothetical protein
VSVILDRAEYRTGDTITISGSVEPLTDEGRVVIQVYNPIRALTRIDPLTPDTEGFYNYSYVLDGPLNMRSGQYFVMVSYLGITEQASFQFAAEPEAWSTYPLNIGNSSYNIRYRLDGATLRGIAADSSLATMAVELSSKSAGSMTIQLPAGISASFGTAPEEWLVFVDSIPIDVRTSWEQCYSEVMIPFEAGTEEIELVGTWLLGQDLNLAAVNYTSTARFSVQDQDFILPVKLNALDCNFSFIQEEKRLRADVMGPRAGSGYFEVTIPHHFLGGNFTVLLQGEPINEFKTTYNPGTDGQDSTTISFGYDPAKVSDVDIIGTTAIPEFSHAAVAVLIAVSIGAVAAVRLTRQVV